jgi:hypothetical protein
MGWLLGNSPAIVKLQFTSGGFFKFNTAAPFGISCWRECVLPANSISLPLGSLAISNSGSDLNSNCAASQNKAKEMLGMMYQER